MVFSVLLTPAQHKSSMCEICALVNVCSAACQAAAGSACGHGLLGNIRDQTS